MTARKTPTFTAENIISILEAAPQGGTTEEVLSRAKAPISTATLDKWIKDGRKDLRDSKQTAYALFAQQWNAVYPGAPPRHEAARMLEIQKALKNLGIQTQCPSAAQSVPDAKRPTRSPKTCECGNTKNPSDACCHNCSRLDSSKAA